MFVSGVILLLTLSEILGQVNNKSNFNYNDSSEYGVTEGVKSTSCDCGRANKSPARIINGEEADENEFPWMVFLRIRRGSKNGRTSYSYCGASIITQRHLLTAAHCVVDLDKNEIVNVKDVLIKLALHSRKNPSDRVVNIDGQKIYVHSKFLQGKSYDIAIIHTKQHIEYSQFIGPICLSPVELPVLNKNIEILGWGQTESGSGSDVLLKAKVEVLNRKKCRLNEWHICASTKPSGICSGDSGSPQVWVDPETNRYTQVSLASRAPKDCVKGFGALTNVTYFYDWIQNIIEVSDSREKTCHKQN